MWPVQKPVAVRLRWQTLSHVEAVAASRGVLMIFYAAPFDGLPSRRPEDAFVLACIVGQLLGPIT